MVTFQFIPFHEIENLGPAKRVNKLLKIVKENKIVLMEGRLKKQEEADLIEITMEEISSKFKGIELSVVYPDKSKQDFGQKVKGTFANILLGDRQGMTIIGPASVVKKIEQNPDKIELFTKDSKTTTPTRRYRKRK
ncbi:DUF2073 domain-containing protein [Candidatus Woesearchaeota archaeon]|jgi:hypothetical protein|nr:DUF2073 domain-containing protein [Candidatus Woesearchaeota archaeon]MBT5342957.1 DUF2073 domain-containing protein [Candidatus Woesearchaeota archaeon]